MSQVEWQQVKEVFYTALSRPVTERADFLDSACGDNGALRSEVEVLLDSYESGFLEDPLLAETAPKHWSNPRFEQGHIFNHYKILKLIGRGGMGEVYLANDTGLDRLTAIKIIHNDSGFGDQAAGRLIREARSAAKLDHPNICSVYEVGETEGQPFIAMQYVEGEMLDSLIERDSITFEDAVYFTRQIATGLAKAHSSGVVHRDIKPSNIILDCNKHIKVLDFGLAKETSTNSDKVDVSAVGLIAGTVAYMSPEHVRGQEINEQTDIWSLGVVFYQMLTGRLPFRGETKADLIARILHNDLDVPADLSGDRSGAVERILNRALQKDRSNRYATIAEFNADLSELAAAGRAHPGLARHLFGFATDRPRSPRTRLPKARLPLSFATMAVLLLALATVLVGIWVNQDAHASPFFYSEQTSGSLQISSLYDLKRQVGGTITDLSFSPDGTMIVFSQTGKGPSSIYVLSVSGGEPVRVSDGASVSYAPVWSPDGERIAYIANSVGERGIWSVSFMGTDATMLTRLDGTKTGCQLRKWSNDERRMFFECGDGPKEIDLETGNTSSLDLTGIEGKVTRGFSLSHDESRFLAVSNENGTEQLWIKAVGDSDARRIHETDPRNGMPQWFPDDRSFAYSANRNGNYQIYVRGLDDTDARQVTFGNISATDPVVSPDGRQIVYISDLGEANLFVLDLKSRKEGMLTRNVNMQLFPRFSPNGRYIAYQTISNGSTLTSGQLKIDLFESNGITTKSIIDQPGCCVQWSPSGEEIAFVQRNGTDSDIWKFRIADGSAAKISKGGISMPSHAIAPFDLDTSPFAWSPDGSTIAFVSKRSGQANIWTGASDGSSEVMLTDFHDGVTRAVSPCWSPDGSRIAFVEAIGTGPTGSARENRIAIYDSGTIKVVGEFTTPISLLGWSRSGGGVYVAVTTDHHYEIHLVSASRPNDKKKIIQLPNHRRFGVKLSPDQGWIAYSQRVDGVDNLVLVPTSGGDLRRVTSNDDPTVFYSGVTWSPDSTSLLYSKQTGGLQISLISPN